MDLVLVIPIVWLTLLALTRAGDKAGVRAVISGGVLFLLGLAAALPDWDTPELVPASAAAVNIGLMLFGWAKLDPYPWWLVRRPALSLGALVWFLGFVIIGYHATHLAPHGDLRVIGGGLAVFVGLVALGTFLGWIRPRVRAGRLWKWLDDRWLCPARESGPSLRRTDRLAMTIVALLGIALAVWSNALLGAMAGALLSAFAVHRLGRETGHSTKTPWSPILAGVGIVAFTWFVTTIAGNEIPWRFPGIIDAPFSDRAEALAILMLAGAVWVLLGLWPFHGIGPASALAIAGGALLLRWGLGLIPGGVDHAAPLFAIVAAVAAIHASATGRVGEYAGALGVLGVISGGHGAWYCFALATLAAVLHYFDRYFPIFQLGRRQLVGILTLPALALVLPWSLRVETTMSVVVVLAGVALFRPLPTLETAPLLG